MAVSPMSKFIIVSHASEASELLEEVQQEGICQILKGEQALICREWPELRFDENTSRDLKIFVNRLSEVIDFLGSYTKGQKGLSSVLAPRTVIDKDTYERVIRDQKAAQVVTETEDIGKKLESLSTEKEVIKEKLVHLKGWVGLDTPVEELKSTRQVDIFAGLLGEQNFDQASEALGEAGAALEVVGQIEGKRTCVIGCMTDKTQEIQKLLRGMDFEPAHFENMTGRVSELVSSRQERLAKIEKELKDLRNSATKLAENLLSLKILYDHHRNLIQREETRGSSAATNHAVLLEGWVKKKHYDLLEEVVSRFGASSLNRVEPGESEDIPVEIENKRVIKPFEIITRLYGMPHYYEVDPTLFLAPFFALFFGLCLTDAGYGLALIIISIFLVKKMQGDKKLLAMLGICGVLTVVAGALTGSWFGDAIQQFIPALEPLKDKMMWFDPLQDPMTFFVISLALGYVQLITGVCIAFGHNIKRGDFIAAICDQLTWLVILNSVLAFAFAKAGVLPSGLAGILVWLIIAAAVVVLLFSHREGGVGERLGLGFYNLFSSIFYVGDTLSYLRLMALGMVTAGLAMAINVIAKMVMEVPYGVGLVLGILILVVGHGFNMAMNSLGAFVHTLRLQYAEFFPKFFVGGGKLFEPLSKEYKHVYITRTQESINEKGR